MMMADAKQYASDDFLGRVTDEQGQPAIRSRDELEGEYDVELVFDPANLDEEHVIKIIEALATFIPAMDRNKTIETSALAQQALCALMPYLPAGTIRPVDTARYSEILDEIKNYGQIRMGVMPAMDEQGNWDYGARLEFYNRMIEADPTVFDDMAPQKRANLKAWMDGLAHQQEQFGANVKIGQSGVKDAQAAEAPE